MRGIDNNDDTAGHWEHESKKSGTIIADDQVQPRRAVRELR